MGGWTVLYYILKYPPTDSTIEVAVEAALPDTRPPEEGKGYLHRERSRNEEKSRVQVAGAFVLCPMVEGGYHTACPRDSSDKQRQSNHARRSPSNTSGD